MKFLGILNFMGKMLFGYRRSVAEYAGAFNDMFKFADIARALDASDDTPEASIEAVKKLRHELQIPLLRSYNIERKDLAILAKDALGRNSNCVTNPRTMSEQDAIDVYMMALEEE